MNFFRSFSCLFLALWFGLGLMSAHAYDPFSERLPDCPAPPASKWYWVGQSMVVNGLPMSIKYFESPQSLDAVVRFYEDYWKTRGHAAVTRKTFGHVEILSVELDGYLTSIQLTADNRRVSGKIAVSLSPSQVKRPGKTTLPLPPGATVMSRVESRDGVMQSESLTLIADRSIDFTISYYQNQLVHAGWNKLQEENRSGGWQGQFQSGQGQLQIGIKPLPGGNGKACRILIHWIK